MMNPTKNLTAENYDRRFGRLARAWEASDPESPRRRAVKAATFRLLLTPVPTLTIAPDRDRAEIRELRIHGTVTGRLKTGRPHVEEI